MSTPAMILNNSPVRWVDVPVPADAMVSFPGLALGVDVRGEIFPLPQIGVARPARRNCPIYES
jgi:hypothetical protein